MNEGFAIYLNLDEAKSVENEKLIEKIDDFLLQYGVVYSGIRNLYFAREEEKRDDTIARALEALKQCSWLEGILAFTPILRATNVCSVNQIHTDGMSKPKAGKYRYYEKYYKSTGMLPHAIVVDEHNQIQDGYISYLLACKYDLSAEVISCVKGQPLYKIVSGRHVCKCDEKYQMGSRKIYSWNYDLQDPVIPGDILEVCTSKGKAYMCVEQIGYESGTEFCKAYKSVTEHTHKRIEKKG